MWNSLSLSLFLSLSIYIGACVYFISVQHSHVSNAAFTKKCRQSLSHVNFSKQNVREVCIIRRFFPHKHVRSVKLCKRHSHSVKAQREPKIEHRGKCCWVIANSWVSGKCKQTAVRLAHFQCARKVLSTDGHREEDREFTFGFRSKVDEFPKWSARHPAGALKTLACVSKSENVHALFTCSLWYIPLPQTLAPSQTSSMLYPH